MQPTIPLTYEQALVAPRVFENRSYYFEDGTYSELWGCLNCSTWGDTDCSEDGSSITEFITEDNPESGRPMVWEIVTDTSKRLYVKYEGVTYRYDGQEILVLTRTTGTVQHLQELDESDVIPSEVKHLIDVYG